MTPESNRDFFLSTFQSSFGELPMADLSEVRDQLVQLVTNVVFPNGTDAPSIIGTPVIVYPGWPDPTTLQDDITKINNGDADGRVHVTVYPRRKEKATTRYRATAQTIDSVPAQLVLTHSGNVLTVSGAVHPSDNLAVQAGPQVFTYQVKEGDALQDIANVIAGFVPGAQASGLVVAYPDTVGIEHVATGGHGRQLLELRRQRREIQITVWCADDASRSRLAAPIDVALASTRFLSFSDGTGGRLVYRKSPERDERTPVKIYRRDLIYWVEYATTQVIPTTQIVAASAVFDANSVNGAVVAAH
jgi:hypothetical protein